jgi:hypothetical protein
MVGFVWLHDPNAMLRRSKPTVFKPVPYQRERSPRRVPRWLIILLLGIAIGAGGLWYAQEQYMPPRLSAAESSQLKADLEQAGRDRDRLSGELKDTSEKLAATEAEGRKAQADLASARQSVERLQKDLTQFVQALPPDPRGGPIGIRAASFAPTGGQLSYHVIFTRQRKGDDSFKGVMQLVVTGTRAAGREESVSLPTVPLAMESFQHLSGNVAMPEGMVPREIMIRVLRGAGGEMVAMRVFKVS